ncbi:hypothetical protein ACH4UM_01875 [Streptomyces sp. NPDC020801]|uniref:hypothetical protein n=1 Tax=unclassified Streptomyces TaxID=2593676 RepID=UPI0037A8AB71
MGERQSDRSARGRRRVHPDGAGPGVVAGTRDAGVPPEALLAAALRVGPLDAAAEQRAVEAFRAARAAGADRAARTRRRDDWRPRERRRVRREVKATIALFLASLTLGGVAVAAIGPAGWPGAEPGGGPRSSPSAATPAGTSEERPTAGSRTPGASATPSRPDTARDTEAHCRAYEQVKGRGKALGATAWQRLVAAAGGEENVTAYCAQRLERAAAGKGADRGDGTGKAGKATGTPQDPRRNRSKDAGRGSGKNG